jgi:hypothetical protein
MVFNPQPTLPKVKIDITSDEALTERPVRRPIGHQYSDAPLPVNGVFSYSLTELFAESSARSPSAAGPGTCMTLFICTGTRI